jgi:hypothetical protein
MLVMSVVETLHYSHHMCQHVPQHVTMYVCKQTASTCQIALVHRTCGHWLREHQIHSRRMVSWDSLTLLDLGVLLNWLPAVSLVINMLPPAVSPFDLVRSAGIFIADALSMPGTTQPAAQSQSAAAAGLIS